MSYTEQADHDAKLSEPDLSGTYSARDYIHWRFDELVELIHGKILKRSPGPLTDHQRVTGRLHFQLAKNFNTGKGCELFIAPLDVYLVHPGEDWRDSQNIVEPDLFVVCDPRKMHQRGCIGSPDFVVEVLSPGTRKKDASLKLELYEEYGVKEYWMVSIEERLILVNLLKDDGTYAMQKPVVEGQSLAPHQFPELQVDLTALFAGLSETSSGE